MTDMCAATGRERHTFQAIGCTGCPGPLLTNTRGSGLSRIQANTQLAGGRPRPSKTAQRGIVADNPNRAFIAHLRKATVRGERLAEDHNVLAEFIVRDGGLTIRATASNKLGKMAWLETVPWPKLETDDATTIDAAVEAAVLEAVERVRDLIKQGV